MRTSGVFGGFSRGNVVDPSTVGRSEGELGAGTTALTLSFLVGEPRGVRFAALAEGEFGDRCEVHRVAPDSRRTCMPRRQTASHTVLESNVTVCAGRAIHAGELVVRPDLGSGPAIGQGELAVTIPVPDDGVFRRLRRGDVVAVMATSDPGRPGEPDGGAPGAGRDLRGGAGVDAGLPRRERGRLGGRPPRQRHARDPARARRGSRGLWDSLQQRFRLRGSGQRFLEKVEGSKGGAPARIRTLAPQLPELSPPFGDGTR